MSSIHSTHPLPPPGTQHFESDSYEMICAQLQEIVQPFDSQKGELLSNIEEFIEKILERLGLEEPKRVECRQLATDQETHCVVEFVAAWLRLYPDDIFYPNHPIYNPIWIILHHRPLQRLEDGEAMRIIGHVFNSAILTPTQQQWLLYSLFAKDMWIFADGLYKNIDALREHVHPVVLGNFIHFLQETCNFPDVQLLKVDDSCDRRQGQQLQDFVDKLSIPEEAKEKILQEERILAPSSVEGWVSIYKTSRNYLLPWSILSEIHEALNSFSPQELSDKITPEEMLEHNFVSQYLLEYAFEEEESISIHHKGQCHLPPLSELNDIHKPLSASLQEELGQILPTHSLIPPEERYFESLYEQVCAQMLGQILPTHSLIPPEEQHFESLYAQVCSRTRKIVLPRSHEMNAMLFKTQKCIEEILERLRLEKPKRVERRQWATDQEVLCVAEFAAAWLRLYPNAIFNHDHFIYRSISVVLNYQPPWYSDDDGRAMSTIGLLLNSAILAPNQQQWLLCGLFLKCLNFFANDPHHIGLLKEFVRPVVLGNFIHFLQKKCDFPSVQSLEVDALCERQRDQQLQDFVGELSIPEEAKGEISREKRILVSLSMEEWVSIYKTSRNYLLPLSILNDIHEALNSFPPQELSDKITPEEMLEHNFVSRHLLGKRFGVYRYLGRDKVCGKIYKGPVEK